LALTDRMAFMSMAAAPARGLASLSFIRHGSRRASNHICDRTYGTSHVPPYGRKMEIGGSLIGKRTSVRLRRLGQISSLADSAWPRRRGQCVLAFWVR